MHDPQVLTRDTGFELALSTRVSSAQFLNQQMCDSLKMISGRDWTVKMLFFILLIIEDDREHGQQEPIDFTDHASG